mmetsp:Transcript_19318/g.46055  ORF Transcript_19318/g.46055 Transcript_19318/m.46055 type:complete len:87 (+) Transcript_19318:973-1233(+)
MDTSTFLLPPHPSLPSSLLRLGEGTCWDTLSPLRGPPTDACPTARQTKCWLADNTANSLPPLARLVAAAEGFFVGASQNARAVTVL